MFQGMPWWVWVIQAIGSVASIAAFIQSGRAARLIRIFGIVVHSVEKAVGSPDPRRAYVSSGPDLTAKVESLDANQIEMLKLMLLMANDMNAGKRRGEHRIDTDSIQLPPALENYNGE